MGKRKRRSNKRRKKGDGDPSSQRTLSWLGEKRSGLDDELLASDATARHGWESLCRYYREQLGTILSTEDDVRNFETSLRKALPVSIRVNPSPMSRRVAEHVAALSGWDEVSLELGNVRVWQCPNEKYTDSDRRTMELLSRHGCISFQELVSMLPVAAAAPKPSDAVLDLCSAPGSKATLVADLMKMPHGEELDRGAGVVIAADRDVDRVCLALGRNLARAKSPLVVSAVADASAFPHLRYGADNIDFNVILADVPCSGDGTLRKNKHQVRFWRADFGLSLFSVQRRILLRGLLLLPQGGRLVYSTCSLNPVENEAVVSAALSRYPDIQLEDVHMLLPKSVRSRPGINTWRVPGPTAMRKSKAVGKRGGGAENDNERSGTSNMLSGGSSSNARGSGSDVGGGNRSSVLEHQGQNRTNEGEGGGERADEKDATLYSTYEDLPKEILEAGGRDGCVFYRRDMFPSGHDLSLTARLMPHDNDAGAFYVAVFSRPCDGSGLQRSSTSDNGQNVAEGDTHDMLDNNSELEKEAGESAPTSTDARPGRKDKSNGGTPLGSLLTWVYAPVATFPEEWESIRSFYGLESTFGADGKQLGPDITLDLVWQKMSDGTPKRLCLVSCAARRALLSESHGCGKKSKPLLPALAGSVVFDRIRDSFLSDEKFPGLCRYRPSTDGVAMLAQFTSNARKLLLEKAQFVALLRDNYVALDDLDALPGEILKDFKQPETGWAKLGGLLVSTVPPAAERDQDDDGVDWEEVWVPAIMTPKKVVAYVADAERECLLWLLGSRTETSAPVAATTTAED